MNLDRTKTRETVQMLKITIVFEVIEEVFWERKIYLERDDTLIEHLNNNLNYKIIPYILDFK